MKTVNLDEWVQSGQGAQGTSYNSKNNPDIMLKLYDCDVDTTSVMQEHELAVMAAKLGICTPDPGEVVTDGKRLGLIFQRIRNKRSFSRIISQEPERLEEIARLFARECKKLHSIPLDDSVDLPDCKVFLRKMADNEAFSAKKRVFISSIIDSMPESKCYIHGDLHFGNMITDGEKNYFIDMGFFAKGCPAYDLGMTRFICLDSPLPIMRKEFHMTRRQGRQFWKYFSDEYFGQDHAFEEEVKKYERLKIEWVGYFKHVPLPLVYLFSGNWRLLFKQNRL